MYRNRLSNSCQHFHFNRIISYFKMQFSWAVGCISGTSLNHLNFRLLQSSLGHIRFVFDLGSDVSDSILNNTTFLYVWKSPTSSVAHLLLSSSESPTQGGRRPSAGSAVLIVSLVTYWSLWSEEIILDHHHC